MNHFKNCRTKVSNVPGEVAIKFSQTQSLNEGR